MQHYMIKFVSDLRQVEGFLWALVSSTNKTDRHDITELLLKYALITIAFPPYCVSYFFIFVGILYKTLRFYDFINILYIITYVV